MLCAHSVHYMKTTKMKKARRRPVNLSLTVETIECLQALKSALNRSGSNTVEELVKDKARDLKLIAA